MTNLHELRKKIDHIDGEILNLLSERFHLMSDVIFCKKREGILLTDEKREEKMFSDRFSYAEKKGISSDFVKKIFDLIVAESKKYQERE